MHLLRSVDQPLPAIFPSQFARNCWATHGTVPGTRHTIRHSVSRRLLMLWRCTACVVRTSASTLRRRIRIKACRSRRICWRATSPRQTGDITYVATVEVWLSPKGTSFLTYLAVAIDLFNRQVVAGRCTRT
jgi:hypothetical protein